MFAAHVLGYSTFTKERDTWHTQHPRTPRTLRTLRTPQPPQPPPTRGGARGREREQEGAAAESATRALTRQPRGTHRCAVRPSPDGDATLISLHF